MKPFKLLRSKMPAKKRQQPTRTVDFSLLLELFPAADPENSKQPAGKDIEKIIAKHGKDLLGKHIIIKPGKGTKNIGKTSQPFAIATEILVQGLIFECPEVSTPLELSAANIDRFLSQETESSGIQRLNHLVFKDNLFRSDIESEEVSSIEFSLSAGTYVEVKENIFEHVDLRCFLQSNEYNFLEIERNELRRNYLAIASAIDKNYSDAKNKTFSRVDSDFVADNTITKQIEDHINREENESSQEKLMKLVNKIESDPHDSKNFLEFNYYNKKQIKISRDDLLPASNRSYIRIKDNKIYKLATEMTTPAEIVGNNEINAIVRGRRGSEATFEPETKLRNIECNLYWGPHNKINPKYKYALGNLGFFLSMRNRVIALQDKHQEAIINREVLKCKETLLETEDSASSWQEKLILWFGRKVSDHGTSLWRPFACVLGLNIVTAPIIFCSSAADFTVVEFFRDFLNLFNPFSSIPSDAHPWLLFIYLLQKAFLYLFIYELIRVGRRFIVK